jgi:hypothetical protein
MFQFSIGPYQFEWNWAHTVNVFNSYGENIDVFSLDYGKNNYTPQEVLVSAYEWWNTH